MDYFDQVYLNRLNRYGNNYQERVLKQRREVFARRLLKSVYRIEFNFNDEMVPATFERYKQNETQIFRYLFTAYDMIIPNGEVLLLPDPIGIIEEGKTEYPEYSGSYPLQIFDEETQTILRPWMVYYLEDTSAKGYNRYIMLKMTHYLQWKDRDKVDHWSYAYMYGQEDNMLKDEIRSRSRMDPIYAENLKSSFFIMPATDRIRKDDYFIIDKVQNNKVLDEYYRVTGYDIQSQDGVEYITVDPLYKYADDFYDDVEHPVIKPKPQETEEEKKAREKRQKEIDEDYFWLTGQTTNVEAE